MTPALLKCMFFKKELNQTSKYNLIYRKFREYRNRNMLNNIRRNNKLNPKLEKFYRTNDPICSTS